MRKPAAAASVAVHGTALLVLFSLRFYTPAPARPAGFHFVTLAAPPRPIAKTGGGGQRQPIPASRGRAPEAAVRRFVLPPAVVHNDAPKLVIQQALIETPEINIQSAMIGDPLALAGIPSAGFGGPAGIGDGGSGGIGDGPGGPRLGGPASVKASVKLTRQPQLLYKEEPEYSEEARKARYEGTVVIAFDVDTSGRPIHIRVARSLGLGLDEKAMAAVAHWKFRPAAVGERPVIAPAEASVTFRLL